MKLGARSMTLTRSDKTPNGEVYSSPPSKKKVKLPPSKTKTMLIPFIDAGDLVHHEYLSEGQTINQNFCISVLHLENSFGITTADLAFLIPS